MAPREGVVWFHVGRMMHVHWLRPPVWESMALVIDAARAASTPRGEPLVLLLTHVELRRPSEPVVGAWERFQMATTGTVAHIHAVIDLPGVAGSILRSALDCILILKHATSFASLHGSLDEALMVIGKKHGLPKDEVERFAPKARRHALLGRNDGAHARVRIA